MTLLLYRGGGGGYLGEVCGDYISSEKCHSGRQIGYRREQNLGVKLCELLTFNMFCLWIYTVTLDQSFLT